MKILESLNEHYQIDLYEALKLLHDKNAGIIAVASDQDDPKKASNETYKNRQILKSAGFSWKNGRWIIDSSEFNRARDVISKVNKTEYIITKLEDVQEFINDKVKDSKKDILQGKIQSYIDKLANATDEAAASEEIKRYLDFFSTFYQYSFQNKILIYIQNPKATRVASFNNWKKKGRAVKKGAKGMAIFVPIFPKGKNPKYDDIDDSERSSPVFFKVGYVFDIADTEATSEKGEVPDEPEWWGDNTPNETADQLFDLIRQAAEAEGIDITSDEALGGEKGYSKGGHINITSNVEGVGKVSTLAHEYAHELMHWKDRSKFYIGDEYARDKALKELQAESVSYVVLKHYGLPVQHHTKYLALWKANSEKVKSNIEVISKSAHHIITQIDKAAKKSE